MDYDVVMMRNTEQEDNVNMMKSSEDVDENTDVEDGLQSRKIIDVNIDEETLKM